MFTIRDLQLEPRWSHYITELKFLSHASVTTLYSINLGYDVEKFDVVLLSLRMLLCIIISCYSMK